MQFSNEHAWLRSFRLPFTDELLVLVWLLLGDEGEEDTERGDGDGEEGKLFEKFESFENEECQRKCRQIVKIEWNQIMCLKSNLWQHTCLNTVMCRGDTFKND